ncbi:cytochrome bc complex cytochrome b subunit [Actinomadura sp. K4S16]|uniref:cytochrome bc1 complex cytochrome b subunit n=1 Tax=Actinomadura sp. K4S16 TaxID=1316147 RepID=UPI0011EF39CD|nr:cytochrome b N-terminal domain-containing protein [Actinomadura sp. K4S16]
MHGQARWVERWSWRARTDHWSFLFAQLAICSFLVLIVTGAFLTFFFDPDMTQVTYNGSYGPLRGVPVSEAYASTLDISLDVRGGLLMRQIHHWAALVFVAAITLQLLRLFFTGAFRRPRGLNWLIWVTVLVLGMVTAWTGTILPDDMLSGGSLGLLQGVTQAIPLVGTGLTFLIFGDEFPGEKIIPRLYWLHILVLPAVLAALFVLRHRLVREHGHTRFPGAFSGRASRGSAVALLLTTGGVLALLGTFAQINPVWQYGPYRPGDITAGAVPGWYMGFLDGAVRIMPGWELSVAGHPITLAVLVPALLMPGAFFTVLAAYPWIERRLTGDRGIRHVLDRPRDAATRTAVGAAGIAFYGLLWAAAANDQIAHNFHLSLYDVTWFFRVAVFTGPPLAYAVTRSICLGLAYRDQKESEHGRETGRILMSPDGGFSEIHEAPERPLEMTH